MPGVCCNSCFDNEEGECLCHYCHVGYGSVCLVKKYTEMVSSKNTHIVVW